MTVDAFRRLALSFPEAVEGSHMKHPDFRVRGKIFATLAYPDKTRGIAKLIPEQQHEFVHAHPDVFVPVNGGWGRKGATSVLVRAATKVVLRRAMAAAWCKCRAEAVSQGIRTKIPMNLRA